MIILNGIELPSELQWNEKEGYTGIEGSTEMTLDGTLVIWEDDIGNQTIDLVSTKNTAWLTYAQVRALKELAKIKGAVYTLEYNNEVLNVRFRSEDNPVLEVAPLIPRSNTADSDYFYGTIKLMEVV